MGDGLIQYYRIGPYTFSEIEQNPQLKQDEFVLISIAPEEADKLPELLGTSQAQLDSERLEQLKSILSLDEDTGNPYFTILPKVMHLGRHVHFVRYRDVDRDANEKAVTFCLAHGKFVLMASGYIELEQIRRWAQRGILLTPLDLADIMSLEVFYHYQTSLDKMESHAFQVEKDILVGPKVVHQIAIMQAHREVMAIKKSINLHQTVLARLSDIASRRSIPDELEQTVERLLGNAQTVHDMVENLRDAYQTAVQNRTNDIMKVLTILATILLPINLLTSFFGMNFVNLPLIKSRYGLVLFYLASVVIGIAALAYFKKRDWLFIWHRNKV
ncbi:MAG: hypothetical protein M0Z55_01365 [Peptococcaceae bacterium]|nr:hypothetical protein [Peptococcaceae bacterium]